MALTVEENQVRLAELRAKLIESIEMLDSWQEAERKKRESVPPKLQTEPISE
jgi:hypothetical protein